MIDYELKVRHILSERVDTTLNASITELFPAIAFNLKYKPKSVEDFKKFLYTLNPKRAKSSWDSKDEDSAKLVISKLPSRESSVSLPVHTGKWGGVKSKKIISLNIAD